MVVYEANMQGSKIEDIDKRTVTHFSNSKAMNGNTMMKVVLDKNTVKMNGQPLPPAMGSEMTHILGVFPEIGFLANPEVKL
ncbi:hypothetical protein C1E23_21140, partial [Pseudoalteromonas phenolica]